MPSDFAKARFANGHYRRWLLCALCFGLFSCIGFPIVTQAQYRFDVWTTDDGLPQNAVYGVQQTRDGYLWFTTLDGLVRFDGVRFTVFDKTNTPGIISTRFRALREDSAGVLWAGTEDGILTRYKDGRFTSFRLNESGPQSQIVSIQEEAPGELLIKAHTGLFHWRNEEIHQDTRNLGVPELLQVHLGRSGTEWIMQSRGVLRGFRDGQQFTWPAPNLGQLSEMMLYEDREGGVWISGTLAGLFRVKDGKLTEYTHQKGFSLTWVNDICEDSRGNLWLATHDAGLVRYHDGVFTPFGATHGLPPKPLRKIYADREGTLWLGSDAGLIRVTPHIITAYSTADGLCTNNLYPIFQDRQGAIWLGGYGDTSGSGLSKYSDGKLTSYSSREGLRPVLFESIAEDRDGTIWLGSIGELWQYREGRFVDASDRFALARGSAIFQAIYQGRSGALWFGTQMGLARLQNGAWKFFTTADGLPGLDVKVIFETRDGQLWVGTYGGLARFDGERFASWSEQDGLASNRIRSLYEDADGQLWIGTYDGGISRLTHDRIATITTRDGLYNNGVFQILEDERGFFWISSNRGIYRTSRQMLNELADGKTDHLFCTAFGKADGMFNVECNGGRQPAGIRARDGRLWFPTQAGVAIIDPGAVPFNPNPPPVVIEGCTLDGIAQEGSDTIRIRPGQINLEINYTGLSLIKSEQVQFKYRLAGLDDQWTNAGTRRTAYLSHLAPGEYHFQVIAANSDGVWNTGGATLRIIVVPPFYRTWWFMLVAVMMVATLLTLAYRRRILQLERARAAQETFSRQLLNSQERERKRIAAELHDSLGQSLVIIKNRAALSLSTPDDHHRAIEQLEEIDEAVGEAIDEVKEIAYNLRPFQLDRLGLTKAIEALLKQVGAAQPLRITSTIDGIDGIFSPESEINLYRIVQESLNNIVKHAAASEVNFVITRTTQIIEVKISDNGKGFAPQALPVAEPGRGGFGLTGLAERARIVGGKLSIQSAPGQGTVISLKIDLKDTPYGG
jgi:signal transduction histidine kinase/ligand-binding sensor domain-containing protein